MTDSKKQWATQSKIAPKVPPVTVPDIDLSDAIFLKQCSDVAVAAWQGQSLSMNFDHPVTSKGEVEKFLNRMNVNYKIDVADRSFCVEIRDPESITKLAVLGVKFDGSEQLVMQDQRRRIEFSAGQAVAPIVS